jgi:oligogalacturonide lyase
MRILMFVLLLMCAGCASSVAPPREWIDSDTGHRIVRLTDEPGTQSLYFNQNGYTPDGKRLLVTSPTGLFAVDLETRGIEQIVSGQLTVIIAGHKTGDVYYTQNGVIYAVAVNSHAVRKIGPVPVGGIVSTVNADETLLAGALVEGAAATQPSEFSGRQVGDYVAGPTRGADGRLLNIAEAKEVRMDARLQSHVPMALFTINTVTGELKTFNHCTDWLNHVQFSPTDPALLMFCHEGPWHKVDRIWTMRLDNPAPPVLVHQRTMLMEIAGHEFFSADGQTIYYDLQTPRGEDFWVAGLTLATGERIRYHLQRNEWSVHFNVSADGMLFGGDGGDPDMVAHARDGKWIYLFHPGLTPNVGGLIPDQKDLIQTGVFQSDRLVNMSRHDYKLEPNLTFTPDRKWIVFRSNMFGPTYVFEVEISSAR